MKQNSKLVTLGTALIFSAILLTLISSSQVFAQGPGVDVEKLKQILNETRNAIEANDDPGAITQLDLADQLLGGGGANMTGGGNMTNTTAIVTG